MRKPGLVPLVLGVLALTAVIFYQNHVIALQRHEMVMQLETLIGAQKDLVAYHQVLYELQQEYLTQQQRCKK